MSAPFALTTTRLALADPSDPGEAARRISNSHVDDGPTPCLLSFDDGFISNYELAEHVLAHHDVKALFFICPGLMDLSADAQRRAIVANIFADVIHQGDLPAGVRLMNWDEAARLRDLGHEIGAHSMTHPRLATLGEERLAAEIRDSGYRIRDRLGAAPSWFAFPFGDLDSINAAALAAIGREYAFCRSGVRGLNRLGTHRLGVLADQIDFATGAAWRALIVDGACDARYRHARVRLAAMAEEAEATASP